uniref:Protein kinase domain-containing protein n=1 Tax=Panagrolaimus superbus TaxID=310955 RepID=A0A914YXY2_9BILA
MDIIQNLRRQRELQKARKQKQLLSIHHQPSPIQEQENKVSPIKQLPPPIPEPQKVSPIKQLPSPIIEEPQKVSPIKQQPPPVKEDPSKQRPQQSASTKQQQPSSTPPKRPLPAKLQQFRLKHTEQKQYVVHGKTYTIGCELGRGGSSRVYEAKYNDILYAIKVVDLDNVDQRVFDGYMAEVQLLQDLQGKDGIIQLEDYELKDDDYGKELLVVMEKGENDFQTFLRSSDRSPHMIRYYWESMLNCVKVVHSKTIPTDLTSIVKDCQAGTLNYMSPESIEHRGDDNKFHVPLASDVWSLGCILYLMVYGTPPFGHITSQMGKMNAISTKDIEYKPIDDEHLLNCMQLCLQRDYQSRPTVSQLLEHPYLKPNLSNTSTTLNSAIPNFLSSSLNESYEEGSIIVEKIFEEVRNNTPRTASKNVYKLLKANKN